MRLCNASASTCFSEPRGGGGPAFPTLHVPQLAVLQTASVVVLATTMPFYQLVCIAAHYPEYVCLDPALDFENIC